MKNFFYIAAILLLTNAAIVSSTQAQSRPATKAVLSAANYLVKLYQKGNRNAQQVSVPQLQGYALKQVAIIKDNDNDKNYEYVAVYAQNGSKDLKVVVYNQQNQEQFALAAVKNVRFDTTQNNTRIVVERKAENGLVIPESMIVQGMLEVAQNG